MAESDGLQPPGGAERRLEELVRSLRAEHERGQKRFLDDLVHALRVEHPPKNLWGKWSPLGFGLVVAAFGLFGAGSLNDARDAQKKANERIDTIERTANVNANAIDRIDRDRTARIAASDAKFEAIGGDLRRFQLVEPVVGRLEGAFRQLDDRLSSGRDERLADRDRMLDAINGLKTEVALLRQRLEARARGQDTPFGGERQIWKGPPYPPVLKVRARMARVLAGKVA